VYYDVEGELELTASGTGADVEATSQENNEGADYRAEG
jgi:hypothetical protein